MHERYAVVFRTNGTQATGRLEIDEDRLLLSGRAKDSFLEEALYAAVGVLIAVAAVLVLVGAIEELADAMFRPRGR